jgi:crotonobetainyl-CoA:carnitine CoA-transferase CaiB-like acyl-CoA transferase
MAAEPTDSLTSERLKKLVEDLEEQLRETTEGRPELSLIRNPIIFSGTPVKDYRAPPLLGANTREVLATIGYDDAKLDGLKKQGII